MDTCPARSLCRLSHRLSSSTFSGTLVNPSGSTTRGVHGWLWLFFTADTTLFCMMTLLTADFSILCGDWSYSQFEEPRCLSYEALPSCQSRASTLPSTVDGFVVDIQEKSKLTPSLVHNGAEPVLKNSRGDNRDRNLRPVCSHIQPESSAGFVIEMSQAIRPMRACSQCNASTRSRHSKIQDLVIMSRHLATTPSPIFPLGRVLLPGMILGHRNHPSMIPVNICPPRENE